MCLIDKANNLGKIAQPTLSLGRGSSQPDCFYYFHNGWITPDR